jgi:hypothetical protein
MALKGVGIVAISANSLQTHPQDGPEFLKTQAQEVGFTFPYCFDESQAVAKAYTAACTPDFFVFDQAKLLVYRGQLDDSRPSNGKPVTGKDLRAALDGVLAGHSLPSEQVPSVGCNIKWTPGNAPPYFGYEIRFGEPRNQESLRGVACYAPTNRGLEQRPPTNSPRRSTPPTSQNTKKRQILRSFGLSSKLQTPVHIPGWRLGQPSRHGESIAAVL